MISHMCPLGNDLQGVELTSINTHRKSFSSDGNFQDPLFWQLPNTKHSNTNYSPYAVQNILMTHLLYK